MKTNIARKPRWGSRPFRAPKALEGDFKKAVLDYLEWEGIFAMNVVAGRARVGGDAERDDSGKLQFKNEQWVTLAKKGTADIFVQIPANRKVRNFLTNEIEVCEFARSAWIETKQAGKKLRPEQVDFADECRRKGALFWKLDNAGDLRRAIPPKMELFSDAD